MKIITFIIYMIKYDEFIFERKNLSPRFFMISFKMEYAGSYSIFFIKRCMDIVHVNLHLPIYIFLFKERRRNIEI